MSLTKELFGLDDLVFFLLIDEAGKSYEFQQQILNGWIACRDHSLLSIKMTAIRVEYLTFYTPEKWSIQLTHDYLESSLEVVNYSKEDYKKNIKEIVLRRFKSFGISVDNVESFFPRDVDTIKLIDSEKEKLGFEYKSFGKGKKESFNDYCSRRLMPRVFQILSENKKAPDYSGFDVIVSVSSGIIRNFLVPAERMYDKVKSINGGKEILYIPADIQNEVLYNYSKEFYESIRSRSSFYNKEEYELLTGLENLIKSFGRFFRERLLMKSLSEGRVFSFSIKQSEKLNIRERRVFQLAEQNAYLQKSFVMLKNGAAVEEWYLLSRRLAPFFRLDPTALKGRLEISSKDIDLAMSDPDAFVMKKINSNVLPNQLSIFDDDLEFVNLEDGDHE